MHPTIYGNTYTEVMDLEVYIFHIEKGGVHRLFNVINFFRLALTFPSISKVNSWSNRVSLS